jgi:hypothetical protein
VLELALEALLGRVDQQAAFFSEHEPTDLDEAEHAALTDVGCVQFVQLALAVKHDLVDALLADRHRCARRDRNECGL